MSHGVNHLAFLSYPLTGVVFGAIASFGGILYSQRNAKKIEEERSARAREEHLLEARRVAYADLMAVLNAGMQIEPFNNSYPFDRELVRHHLERARLVASYSMLGRLDKLQKAIDDWSGEPATVRRLDADSKPVLGDTGIGALRTVITSCRQAMRVEVLGEEEANKKTEPAAMMPIAPPPSRRS